MKILKHHTILYAEDESIIRMNIKEELEEYFQKVYTASNGEEAWQCYQTLKPDVLLLDINMPKSNGIEVAKKIRQKDKESLIVMLTAYTDKQFLLDAIELQLLRYIVKPLSTSELQIMLKKVTNALYLKNKHIIELSASYLWDHKEHKLYCHNKPVELTLREQKLLELLIQNNKKNTSIEEIMTYVWEDKLNEEISFNAVKKLVSRLRKKLPEHHIKNVYSSGYVLEQL